MASCCLSNLAGGGGGAVLATPARVAMTSGGLAAAGRPAPTTDCRVGGTAGVAVTTRAVAISLSLTLTMLLCTDCPLVKVFVESTVTPPAPPLFTHLTVVTVTTLFTTTLSYQR